MAEVGRLAGLVALSCVPLRELGGLAEPVSVSVKWAQSYRPCGVHVLGPCALSVAHGTRC